MSFRTALVDRARVVRRTPSLVKAEGRRRHYDEHGPWIAARLTELEAPGALQDGRVRVHRTPELVVASADEHGDPVELRPDDRLQGRVGRPRLRAVAGPRAARAAAPSPRGGRAGGRDRARGGVLAWRPPNEAA